MDAANLERLGLPTAVVGISQLLETVGRATAAAHDLATDRFVSVTGDLHHALDYIRDDDPFWNACVEALVPQIAQALVRREAEA